MNGGIPVSSDDAVLKKKTEGEMLSAGSCCLSKTVLYQFGSCLAQKACTLNVWMQRTIKHYYHWVLGCSCTL